MTIHIKCCKPTVESVKVELELDADTCRVLAQAFAIIGAEFERGSRRSREKRKWIAETLPRLKREHAEREELIEEVHKTYAYLSIRKAAALMKHQFNETFDGMEGMIADIRREERHAARDGRDRQIVKWKVEGKRNCEIAKLLGLALGTVCNAVCRLKKEPPPPVEIKPQQTDAEVYVLAVEAAKRADTS
jgi:ATP/maltotriose-dependent transcriptional regulator MalT